MRSSYRLLCLALALAFGLVLSAASAQETATAVSSAWTGLADRTETAVDQDVVTDSILEDLRQQLTDYRAKFETERSANADRIGSLQAQIAALGEPPADSGEAVPPEVVAKRDELERQLAALQAPVKVADAAFTRANGLIRQIDTILRDRQKQEILAVGPVPLNPVHWPVAISQLNSAISALWLPDEGTSQAAIAAETLRENALAVLVLTVLGLVLIFRGRRWASMIVGSLRHHEARGLSIWRFLVSLLRIFLPLAGLVCLSFAALQSGLLGHRGTELMQLVPTLGLMILGFRWVSERVFSRDEDEALILLPDAERRRARFWVTIITLLIIAGGVLIRVLQLHGGDTAALTVVTFPLTVLMGLAVFRLGQLMRGYREVPPSESEGEAFRAGNFGRVVRGFGSAALLVAVVAPLLQAAGYMNASEQLMKPFVLTLVLMGLILALQRFSADVYGGITGQGEGAREALMPVLFGLILAALATPVLALIWGARVSDLSELWGQFSRGFALGEKRISPTDFLTFVIIFAVGFVLTRLLQGALRSNVLPKTKIDIGGQNAIVSGLGYVGIFLAALVAITSAGIDLSSLAIVAGALSVGIGFGLQNIVSNFVSGIILLIERPISEGDWIEVGGQMGYVRDISVRSTRIETFDRTDVIVPNADLVSGTVTNYTRGNTVGRVIVKVGVAYGTDTKMVEGILREIAEAQPMVLGTPPPAVLFVSFGADALEFEVRMLLRDVNWTMAVKNDVNHEIARRFAEEGIEIPFAQRDLWLRNPEALRPEPQT